MRKTIILLIFSVLCTLADAQSQQVKVVYKNGGSVVGTLVGMDGTTSVTISLAGIEITVPMDEVETIEAVEEAKVQTTSQMPSYTDEWMPEDYNKVLPSDRYGEYVILDKAEYPDSFIVSVGGQDFTMILVRGGVFNMGYDGPGSRSYKTEPVHKVRLSSFYVSREMFNEDVAYSLLGKEFKGDKIDTFRTKNWEEAKQIVDKVAEQESLPYRLLTESEWEYAVITPYVETVFKKSTRTKGYKDEWCSDFMSEYRESPQTNPTGPVSGKRHVFRGYYGPFQWRFRTTATYGSMVRFAISADKIKTINE